MFTSFINCKTNTFPTFPKYVLVKFIFSNLYCTQFLLVRVFFYLIDLYLYKSLKETRHEKTNYQKNDMIACLPV